MNRVVVNEEICKECEYCMTFCPKKSILAKRDYLNKKGYYPVFGSNLEDCIGCGICATVCPEAAIRVEKDV